MSISYQKIIDKMKKELNDLESTSSEQKVVAKMYAIKSLADLIIDAEPNDIVAETAKSKELGESSITDEEARMMGIRKETNQVINNEQKLVEDDANGDSIFDF